MIDPPRHGTVTLDKNGCFTYTPNKGYQGEDSFSYKAKDAISACATKVVTIMIEDRSIQLPKPITSLNAKELTTSQVTLYWKDKTNNKTAYLLYKDGKLHCELNKNKKHITLTNLKPNTNYTFTLKTKNQAGESKGKDITITTKDVTSKPTAPTNLKVLAQDENSIRLGWSDNANNESAYEIYQNGKLLKTISTSCSCTVIKNITKDETVKFEVRAKNRLGSSSGAILTINPKEEPTTPIENNTTKPVENNTSTETNTTTPPENNTTKPTPPENNTTVPPQVINTAPQAQKQTIMIDEDTNKDIILTATDKENDTLSFQIITQPSYGKLTGTAPNLTYTPNENYNGTDSFTFKANDSKLDSTTQTVTIMITSINDKPTVSAGEDIQSTEQLPVTLNATASDIDGEIQSYRWSEANNTLATTASFSKDDFTVGEHILTLTVTDNEEATASDTVTIMITQDPNTAPTLKAQTLTIEESKPLNITLEASDKENDTLSYIITKQPKKGTLTGTAPNLIYTANANYKGSDSFSIKVNDGKLDSEVVTIMIEVTGKPVEVIHGHTLPPEPDEKINNSTLLGIDSNNNGVRDDVERWIYYKYKDKHPIYIDIAMQAARGYKKVLETPAKAKEIHNEVNAVIDCSWYYRDEAQYYNDPILIFERVDDKVFYQYFNTDARKSVYQEYDKLLSGDTYHTLDGIDMKNQCSFDTSKYKGVE
jgi:VCBS repeat-containing protein